MKSLSRLTTFAWEANFRKFAAFNRARNIENCFPKRRQADR